MFYDMMCRCNCTAEIKSYVSEKKIIVSLYVCGSINESQSTDTLIGYDVQLLHSL